MVLALMVWLLPKSVQFLASFHQFTLLVRVWNCVIMWWQNLKNPLAIIRICSGAQVSCILQKAANFISVHWCSFLGKSTWWNQDQGMILCTTRPVCIHFTMQRITRKWLFVNISVDILAKCTKVTWPCSNTISFIIINTYSYIILRITSNISPTTCYFHHR